MTKEELISVLEQEKQKCNDNIHTIKKNDDYISKSLKSYYGGIFEGLSIALLNIKNLDDNCKVMGNTEIYLEDNGDDPPYNQQWIDLDTHEFVIPEGFKAGDKVEILIRKK